MIKIILIITSIAFIFAGLFYVGLIEDIANIINIINNDFISFLPIEVRVFISIIVLAIVLGVAYSFIS